MLYLALPLILPFALASPTCSRSLSRESTFAVTVLQRQASHEMGCAFWSSWDFMGGQNAFARWLEQGLAWTDLMHLTEKGLHRIGQGLADALLHGHEQHKGRP